MDIADWRKQIDETDKKLVELISQRAQAAHEIGKLKKTASMPIYEPDREHEVFENVTKLNHGPLSRSRPVGIYERIIDIMRQIQREEIAPECRPDRSVSGDTEIEFRH